MELKCTFLLVSESMTGYLNSSCLTTQPSLSITNVWRRQSDQIWLLLKDLGKKIAYKSSPNIRLLLGPYWTLYFFAVEATFWITFGKMGLLFILTYGHTSCRPYFRQNQFNGLSKCIQLSSKNAFSTASLVSFSHHRDRVIFTLAPVAPMRVCLHMQCSIRIFHCRYGMFKNIYFAKNI